MILVFSLGVMDLPPPPTPVFVVVVNLNNSFFKLNSNLFLSHSDELSVILSSIIRCDGE